MNDINSISTICTNLLAIPSQVYGVKPVINLTNFEEVAKRITLYIEANEQTILCSEKTEEEREEALKCFTSIKESQFKIYQTFEACLLVGISVTKDIAYLIEKNTKKPNIDLMAIKVQINAALYVLGFHEDKTGIPYNNTMGKDLETKLKSEEFQKVITAFRDPKKPPQAFIQKINFIISRLETQSSNSVNLYDKKKKCIVM